MRTITLLLAMFIVAATQAQTVVFKDNFNDSDISNWTLYDEDGDGNNWIVTSIQNSQGDTIVQPVIRSFSWDGQPLTPNNYIVSPEIDLTGQDGSTDITLSYQVFAADPDFSNEKYSVYVSSAGNTVSDMQNGELLVTELVTDNGPGGIENKYTKTFDLTAYAGETVYIAFRHHDVSNQFSMSINDVKVVSGNLATEDHEIVGFEHYLDNGNTLHLSAQQNLEQVYIYNLIGSQVMTENIDDTEAHLTLDKLSPGLYIGKAQTNAGSSSFKFIVE